MVYGFHPYWQNGAESNYNFSLLSHLVYFSAEIDSNTGNFSATNNWSSAAVVSTARTYGKKVHLCITLFKGHTALLTNTTAKTNLIVNCLTQLNVRNADGINVDFEAVGSSVKTEFRNFVKQLGDSLKAHGKELAIELPAVDWSGIFDATFFSTTSPVTDFYFLMAYDYYWKGSTNAGPVAGLRGCTSEWHVMRSIDTYLSRGCNATKLIAGFPYYGYDWPVTSSIRMAPVITGQDGIARYYNVIANDYIDTVAVANKTASDATYNVPWYNYQGAGTWRQCWYDDSLSLAKKYDSVKTRNIGGVGMWALGYDDGYTSLWGALKAKFASTPNASFISLANFESGVGVFSSVPTFSGTTVGISTSSTAAQSFNESNNGSASIQLVLKDNSSVTTNWAVRFLSGGGTPANNTSLSATGYLGFWMKTSSAPANAKVALSVDDGPGGTLISSKQSVIADGTWQLYQWNLASTTWSILAGSDAVLNGPICTLDAIMLYGDNTASDWTLYIDDVSFYSEGPLPVILASIEASVRGGRVLLSWHTASEHDNVGFCIERKDASHPWNQIGFVSSTGSQNAPRSYTYSDQPRPGVYVYRLKQIDNNGRFSYSDEVTAHISSLPTAMRLNQNYPNPFNPATVVRFAVPTAQQATLKIYNSAGQEVATLFNGMADAGRMYELSFDGSQLASGVYFSILQSGGKQDVKKMTLLR